MSMPRWVERWVLVGVVLLGFGLRLYRLGAGSLWYDETVSVHLAGKALPALVAHTAGDIHPPGYYVLLHGWLRLAGGGVEAEPPAATLDYAAAFFSLFFGMLLVALAYRLARVVYGPPAGVLAAALVAISPYNAWYSQEVRMYTLGAALGVGLLYTVLRLLRQAPDRRAGVQPWAWLGLYALLGALGLWSLYYFAFLLLAMNLMVGAWWLVCRLRPSCAWLGRWALAQAGVLVLYSPWIPVAWRQATEPPVPPWRSFTGLGQVLVESWTALSLGQSAADLRLAWPRIGWPALLLFAALFVLGLGAGRMARRRRGGEPGAPGAAEPLFLAGSVLLPVLLIYLASLVTPLYHVRYVFPYSTSFYAVLAAGLVWLARRRRAWGRVLAGLALSLIVILSAFSLHAYHTDPRYAADDHEAAVAFMRERWRPGDAILVDAGYAYPALLHYWDGEPIAWRGRLVGEGADGFAAHAGEGPVLVLAGTVGGDAGLGWGDPESDFYAMSREEAAGALERLFATHHRVWVYRIYDTVTDPEGFLRDWLAEHGTPFEDQVFTGEAQLRVQGFLAGRDPLAGMTARYDALLPDRALSLLASDLPASDPAGSGVVAKVAVGQALDLALVWRVGEAPPADWILFLGLFDGAGQRWAQTDERPVGALYPLADWPPGVLVRTPLRLHVPPGTPPGAYRLEVGWYRFQDGQPVWLPWSAGERLELGLVQVAPPAGGWHALPPPDMAYGAGVAVGDGVRLLGFDAPSLSAQAGQALRLDLYWQAAVDGPAPGAVVLQLVDAEGRVVAEVAGAPAGGRAPFPGLAAGQMVRDPRQVLLPAGLAPGAYDLLLGRRAPDGPWLPVRRGPFPLGETYPLATIHVPGRALSLAPPTPEHSLEARFGQEIRLLGWYDERTGPRLAVFAEGWEPGDALPLDEFAAGE